jgi:septum site-determining protein MinC
MAAVPPGNAPAIFDLRSASLTLVALLLKSTDVVAIAHELEERFGKGFNPFDSDPIVIDLSGVREAGGSIDFAELSQLLRAHRMQPIAVKGGTPEQMQAALEAGLTEAPETAAPPPRPEPAPPRSSAPSPAPTPPETPERPETPVAAPSAPTVILDRPLRSGQQIYARGADLVVLGVVNVGAEVIADGNIHVYAPLRGRAIAGARGNASARIFSTNMEPQLVSIAGTYRTTETALPDDILGKPAQVRLDGERLVFEALKL